MALPPNKQSERFSKNKEFRPALYWNQSVRSKQRIVIFVRLFWPAVMMKNYIIYIVYVQSTYENTIAGILNVFTCFMPEAWHIEAWKLYAF